MSPQERQPSGFTKVMDFLPTIEKVVLTAVMIGVILALMKVDVTVAKISLLVLAGIFFLMAYRRPPVPFSQNERNAFPSLLGLTILPKVLWIACSVSAVGISFYFKATDLGYKQMMFIGGTVLAFGIVLFVILMVGVEKQMVKIAPVLIRAVPLCAVDFYLMMPFDQ